MGLNAKLIESGPYSGRYALDYDTGTNDILWPFYSGDIASGQVGNPHMASGAILSGSIASGQLGPNHLASGAVLSGHVASGQLGISHFQSGLTTSGLYLSGSIGSGQLGTDHISSGAIVSFANSTVQFQSGTGYSILTEETISGVRAVCVSQSGNLRIAMAAVSGRMPAIGVMTVNVLSGLQALHVHQSCFQQLSSGMVDFSGRIGSRIWVGRSGQLSTISGSWSSGGFASGDIGQPLGIAVNSGGAIFMVTYLVVSGGALGFPPGGPW